MNIINLYDYAKEGFNWELLIAFADFVISCFLSIIAYKFSLNEKIERYKKEIREYYDLIIKYTSETKNCYSLISNELELYLNHKETIQYKDIYDKIVKNYENSNNELDMINTQIIELNYNDSCIRFNEKYPFLQQYLDGCQKCYLEKFCLDMNYIKRNRIERININDERLRKYKEDFKEYENNITKLQHEYEESFFKLNKNEYCLKCLFEENLKKFIDDI